MKKLDGTLKVLSLVRVSTDAQADEDRGGIPRQLASIERHCSNFNLKVVDTFNIQVSGKYVQDSPDFQDMLSRLTDPSIDGIVFATIDRFFRPEDWEAYSKTLMPFVKAHKVMFCDLGKIDPADNRDMQTLMMYGQAAKLERERIKERTTWTRENNRSNPNKKTDPLPAGVEFKDGKFSYTPESAKVKTAFQRVAAGDTLGMVAKDLQWASVTALRTSLKQYWWIGIKATLDKRTGKNGERRVKRDKPIMVRTNLADAPLVKPEVFEHVQEILKQKAKTWTQARSHVKSFLGGDLIHCGCGAKMYHVGDTRPGNKAYYVCGSRFAGRKHCTFETYRLQAVRTDAEIVWSVLAYMTDEKFLKARAAEAVSTEQAERIEREIKIEQKNLSAVERKTANLMTMVEEEGYTPALKLRLKTLSEQETVSRQKIRQLQNEIPAKIDPASVARNLHAKFLNFGSWDKPQQKAALAQYVTRITFDGRGNAEFSLKVPASVLEPDKSRKAYLKSQYAMAGIDPSQRLVEVPNGHIKSETPAWSALRFYVKVAA